MCNSVNIIIHNAWRLDFNLSLSSFESNIRSTRTLIDLALSSPQPSNIRFIFTSSIQSAQRWNKSDGSVPETLLSDPKVAVGTGYGEGKYVAEQVCHNTFKIWLDNGLNLSQVLANSRLNSTSFRIGQICGSFPRGAWSTSDWTPIMIKSGLEMGALPDTRGV